MNELREKIARIYAKEHAENPPCDECYARADQILTLIREEIEKSLLTDAERMDLYAKYDGAFESQWEDALLQAQLDKILKALEVE